MTDPTDRQPAGPRRLRVMVMTRLYSGLRASFAGGVWKPSGAPAMAKLWEGLDRSEHDLSFLLAGRGFEPAPEVDALAGREIRLEGFGRGFRLLRGEWAWPRWIGTWRSHLATLAHTAQAWRMLRRFRPDVVYADRTNVVTAALIARLTRTPVVLRVLGVYSAAPMIAGRGPYARLQRWAFRAPFAAVVCSQDGSPAEPTLAALLSPSTPRHVVLNGVDFPQDLAAAAPDPLAGLAPREMIVAFLGRIEPGKGAVEFVEAMLRLKDSHGARLRAVVVGDGSLAPELRARVEAAGAGDMVALLGARPHAQVRRILRAADVYVSLNFAGNLSNANLEALAAGACLVIPHSDPETGIDLSTDGLLPDDVVLRIPRVDVVAPLAETIAGLCDRTEERRARAARAEALARRLLVDWPTRIAQERRLIEAAAERRGPVRDWPSAEATMTATATTAE